MPAGIDDGTITVKPDQAIVHDPHTRYPVYLDPNMFFARGQHQPVSSR
jgi:hypothetical protein